MIPEELLKEQNERYPIENLYLHGEKIESLSR